MRASIRHTCLPLILLAGGSLGADPAPGTVAEIEALKARVAGLEISLGDKPGETVSTAAAGEAGIKARAGAGDAALVQAMLKHVQGREGPALSRELGRLLDQGEAAYPTLLDFSQALESELGQAAPLTYNYRIAFSLVHLAAVHRDGLARYAHFFLAASRDLPKSSLRRTLFEFLPDFLRYHRGRYAELTRALEEEILARLREGKGSLSMYYNSMDLLGYKPPMDVFEPLLLAAQSQADTLPVVRHLQSRDDREAVGILTRCIDANPPGLDWKSGMMLSALARMNAENAERTLWRYLHAPNDNVRGSAVQAYFGLPRNERDLPILRDFLNANVRLEQKRLVILKLRQSNPGILAALQAEADQMKHEEVKALLRGDTGKAAR